MTVPTQTTQALLGRLAQVHFIPLKPVRTPPAGYWTDRDGRLVHIEDVADYEQLRETYLAPLLHRHLEIYLGIADLKARYLDDIEALLQLCWERHRVKFGGKKNNVTLYTFDGLFRIERNFQNRTRYDEQIGAAEALIKEFLDDVAASLPTDARTLISNAFERNAQGDIRRAEMIRLRGLKIEDERYRRAMQIIAAAEQIIDRACYFTVSVRDAGGKYQPLPLDLASVRPHKAEPVPVVAPVRPIRTEADYRAAMAEIEVLMVVDPAADSPEGERLELLAALAEAWELKQRQAA
jgi:hypothetical protein